MKFKRKKLFLIIVVFTLFTQILIGQSAQSQDFKKELTSMELITENEYLKFYMDKNSTCFAIERKKNNKIWLSNPEQRKKERGILKNELSSQISLIHDPNLIRKNNYRFSIKYNQFKIKEIKNGLRINYRFVEEWDESYYVPLMISKKRMEQFILSKLGQKDREELLEEYFLIELVKDNTATEVELSGLNREKVFGEYSLKILNSKYQKK